MGAPETKCKYYSEVYEPRGTYRGEMLYAKMYRCLRDKETNICLFSGNQQRCEFYPEGVQLKSCPYCGSAAEIKSLKDGNLWLHCVVCKNCGAGTSVEETESDAATKWNRRTNK